MKPIKGRQFNKKKFYLEPEKVLIIRQVLLGLFLFSGVALILTGIWYGTRLSSVTISSVHAVDSETIQAETVKAKVDEVLVGDYWHLVPRRFSWFYPEDKILEKLQEIERIRDVKVEKISSTELAVTFSEYLPYALWCNENDDICYFIDEFGFAFGRAPELTGESLVRYHKLGEDPQLRTSFIDEDDFNKTKEFSHLLSTRDWYVTEIEVDTVRDVFYSLSDGGEIRATLEADTKETFNYLVTLHQSKEFAHLNPGNFQYVDLRFGAKVYVNEEVEFATATSTEGGEGEDENLAKKIVAPEVSSASALAATGTEEGIE
ncbi:MAG: hypothetical protein KBC78_02085 [Candidatus Pacebacteria bacterium]|nr:hypothetical protein [Candidatus Paceibacterota bacterium]